MDLTAVIAIVGMHVPHEVEMNGKGWPTGAGILAAAGLSEHYDTRLDGVIAADADHPDCRLVYAPASGTGVLNRRDGAGC